MRLFLLTVGSFLLTVELFDLQLTILAFLAHSWSVFAYSFSFFTYSWSFFTYSGKVRLIRALRDCNLLRGLPNANTKSSRFSYAIFQIATLPPVVALNRSSKSQIAARYAAFWHAISQIAFALSFSAPKSQRFKSQRLQDANATKFPERILAKEGLGKNTPCHAMGVRMA